MHVDFMWIGFSERVFCNCCFLRMAGRKRDDGIRGVQENVYWGRDKVYWGRFVIFLRKRKMGGGGVLKAIGRLWERVFFVVAFRAWPGAMDGMQGKVG